MKVEKDVFAIRENDNLISLWKKMEKMGTFDLLDPCVHETILVFMRRKKNDDEMKNYCIFLLCKTM